MVMPKADTELGQEMLRKVPSDAVVFRDGCEGQHRLPSYARVQVPMGNKYSNRRTAEILERLAFRLRQIASDTELSVNRARLLTWFEVQTANSDLQEATKSGDSAKI